MTRGRRDVPHGRLQLLVSFQVFFQFVHFFRPPDAQSGRPEAGTTRESMTLVMDALSCLSSGNSTLSAIGRLELGDSTLVQCPDPAPTRWTSQQPSSRARISEVSSASCRGDFEIGTEFIVTGSILDCESRGITHPQNERIPFKSNTFLDQISQTSEY